MISVGRLHQISLTATVVIAALGVVSGSTVTAAAGFVTIACAIVAAPALHELERPRRRAWLVHTLTVGVLIFAIARFNVARIDAILIVVLAGIFNRFLLRAGHRDDLLIGGASTVLIAAATTITPGVAFLPILIGFSTALLWALWTGMILGAAEQSPSDPSVPGAKLASIRAMAVRPAPRQLGPIALGGVGLMLAGYIVVSALPRYYFLNFLGAGAFMPLPGASSSMELTTSGVSDIDESTVVLRVEPNAGTSADSLAGLYARVYALDRFDGRRWWSTESRALFPLRLPADSQPKDRTDAEFGAWDGPRTVRVTLNRLTREAASHPLVTLGTDRPSEVVRRHSRMTMSGSWVTGGFLSAALTYKIHLDRGFDPPINARQLLRHTEEVFAEVPAGLDPRVVALGQQLAEGKDTVDAKVNAVLAHFARGYTYSLEPLRGTSTDPLARFLFEAKEGHCELYAGAVAALLRVAGVRSRVATGYYNGTWNDLGGYLAFTQRDAHAWVEVYEEGKGWRWIDATPEDLRGMREKPALAFLRDWYDAAEAFWFDNVLDYDEERRRELIGRLLGSVRSATEAAESVIEGRRPAGGGAIGVAGAAIAVVLIGAGVPGAALWALRRRKRRSPELLGRRLRRALGEREGENQTLGVLVARTPPALADRARACVAAYEALRFGPTEAAPDAGGVLEAIRALEREKRAQLR